VATKEQNFEIWAGDYREITFVVEDVESLVGLTVNWFLAPSVKAEPLVYKESPEGISVKGNSFTVTLTSGDTKGLGHGSYYHEAVMADDEGKAITVAIGKAVINPSLKNKGVSELD
jgi:hypothetical protein